MTHGHIFARENDMPVAPRAVFDDRRQGKLVATLRKRVAQLREKQGHALPAVATGGAISVKQDGAGET